MTITMDSLIDAVMAKLLSGGSERLKDLYKQYAARSGMRVEFTGVGFSADFDIPKTVNRLDNVKDWLVFGDVIAKINGVKDSVGFIIFVEKGLVTILEGYPLYQREWPETIYELELRFQNKNRDIDSFFK